MNMPVNRSVQVECGGGGVVGLCVLSLVSGVKINDICNCLGNFSLILSIHLSDRYLANAAMYDEQYYTIFLHLFTLF